MYNIVHRAQNKCLVLKSYIPRIDTSILPKKHYENIFSEKMIENNPSVIHSPNVKYSLFVKIHGILVK